ncbi:MAG: hypothetical protein HS129_11415 [Leptospiraceae bacterium]|nr:hypothetical protein [Leptospiraceae bacterium]
MFFFLQKKKKSEKADGTSRESFGAELLGSLSDIGNLATGAYRGGNQTGYIDEAGNYHQRTCFTKGTLVSVHPETLGAVEKSGKWFKKIEEIKEGDYVLSWNEKSGVISYNKVQQTFIRKADQIYTIQYKNGTTVETTWSHRFYVKDKGWVEAKDLQPGFLSHTAFGEMGEIKNVTKEDRNERVYNFMVEKDNTYFVTENQILVHNDAYNFTYNSGVLQNVSTTFMGRTYNSNNGDLTVAQDASGSYSVTLVDENGNEIVANNMEVDKPMEGTSQVRPINLTINNTTLQDGGLVQMNNSGRMAVVGQNNVANGSQVMVLGQDNDGLDSLQSLSATTQGTNRTTYMVYNPTRGFITDTSDSRAMQSNPNNITQRPAIGTLTSLMNNGNSNTYICHSQGGAICANAAQNALDNRRSMANTNMIYIGGAQSHVPNTGERARVRVIYNSWDPVRHAPNVNTTQNSDRNIYRQGQGNGHGYTNYLQDIRCQSSRRETTAGGVCR